MSGALDPDPVRIQYERWSYPPPLPSLDSTAAMPPSVLRDTCWPDGRYVDDMDILVAGCGTSEAARVSLCHPAARVIGIDISEASLLHTERLRERYGLENLTLRRLAIENVADLHADFDFILATGVLHHLCSPAESLAALGARLRLHGVLCAMVYGRYPRAGVEMLRSLFQQLRIEQVDDGLATVKDTLRHLPRSHPAWPQLTRLQDTRCDAGLVDLLLHARSRDYTVSDCIELVTEAGLAFMGWVYRGLYEPNTLLRADSSLFERLDRLQPPDRWAAMERFHGSIDKHVFLACRRDRPRDAWHIDFTDEKLMSWIPVPRRHGFQAQRVLGLVDSAMQPPPPYSSQAGAHSALYRQIDGRRTVAQCVERAALPGATSERGTRPVNPMFSRRLASPIISVGGRHGGEAPGNADQVVARRCAARGDREGRGGVRVLGPERGGVLQLRGHRACDADALEA